MTVSVSVLFPVRNGSRFLAPCIEGVLSQLGSEDQLVVQDGASTDGSLELLQDYAARYRQLSLVSEADDGQSDALNRALRRATGDYVGWTNADDVMAPGALNRVRSTVERTGSPDIVYGDYQVVDEDGGVLRTLRPAELQHDALLRNGCYLFTGATYFKRPLIQSAGLNPRLHFCMDFDLLLRLTSRPKLQSVYVPVTLAAFRYHASSKSGSHGRRFVVEAYRVRRSILQNDEATPRGLYLFNRLYRPAAHHFASVLTTRVRHSSLYSKTRAQHSVGR